MSVSAGVAAAAAAQSAIAAAHARAPRITACSAAVKGYAHDAATMQQRQEYAACIEMLYPQPMEPAETAWMKVAVALLLIGGIAGAIRGWRNAFYGEWIAMSLLGCMVGVTAMVCAAGVVAGFWFGVKFLLS